MSDVKKVSRRKKRALRVRQSEEAVSRATELASELLENGASSSEQLARVSEIVADADLAHAILAFVATRARTSRKRGNAEKASGIYFGALGLLVVWLCYLCARYLYGWVLSAPNEALPACAAACGQAIVIRLSWRILKACGISLADSLNGATFPTVLHKPTVTTPAEDAVRHERLQLLIAEAVARLVSGEGPVRIYREYSRIELTKPAAAWVLAQARIGVLIKGNLPPYHSRSRAYLVAAGAVVGCSIGIALVHSRLSSASQFDYLVTWTVLIVIEFLRTPRMAEEREAA
ncbi:MAG TPA: hypothetical protein VG944_13020 [Fimbriimonas sp.]|nr:hypothetical protein [Fimbriimonas sp.]